MPSRVVVFGSAAAIVIVATLAAIGNNKQEHTVERELRKDGFLGRNEHASNIHVNYPPFQPEGPTGSLVLKLGKYCTYDMTFRYAEGPNNEMTDIIDYTTSVTPSPEGISPTFTVTDEYGLLLETVRRGGKVCF